MPTVSNAYRYVVGVDTHAKVHRYAIVEAATGRVIDQDGFPTSTAGMRRAAEWVGRRTHGELDDVLFSIEGTGSYGSQLAVLLGQLGYRVIDAPCPKRERGQDKTDAIDAIKAARNVLDKHTDRLADVRGGQAQQCAKVLLAARERMSGESTRAINALNALLRGVDLGIDARRKVTAAQIGQVANWRTRHEPAEVGLARAEAVRLAKQIRTLRAELRSNHHQLRDLVATHVPVLLDQVGIGPVNAAVILSVWSHPGRIHHEAALAKLAGVSPIEIASGQRSEHRLNRGGDRQLNRALHSIANTRMRCDPQTKAYLERRTKQGKSTRRIRRCLKRYIARQTFRTLNQAYPAHPSNTADTASIPLRAA